MRWFSVHTLPTSIAEQAHGDVASARERSNHFALSVEFLCVTSAALVTVLGPARYSEAAHRTDAARVGLGTEGIR